MNRIAGSDNKSVFFTHDVSLQPRYIQYVVISYMTVRPQRLDSIFKAANLIGTVVIYLLL
jgi:hypothetical protein